MQSQNIQLKIDEKMLSHISSKIAQEVATKTYYNFLIMRYIPEIKAIEKGKIKAIKGKKIEQYLKQKMSTNK